jgi:hypothetical protein
MSCTSSPTLLGSSPPRALGAKDEEAGLPFPEDFEMLDKEAQSEPAPVWLQQPGEEPTPPRSLRQTLVDAACVLLNVSSTIAIVFINKM